MAPDIPELIYCAGKNATFEDIALQAGYRLGAQLPCATYHPIYFADQDWKAPDRQRYMTALAQHRPTMATVLDWERDEQLADVLDWAEEAAQYVERVLIVPKVQGGIDRLPRRIGSKKVVLAYSVPTRFGGTQVPSWEFAQWPIHLLGGSPQAQMRIAGHLNAIAEVVSADGNMSNKMAHYCRFWSPRPGPKGHWVQLAEVGDGDWGVDANAEAFRRSCANIMAAWSKQ
jgi:hypothetical protein